MDAAVIKLNAARNLLEDWLDEFGKGMALLENENLQDCASAENSSPASSNPKRSRLDDPMKVDSVEGGRGPRPSLASEMTDAQIGDKKVSQLTIEEAVAVDWSTVAKQVLSQVNEGNYALDEEMGGEGEEKDGRIGPKFLNKLLETEEVELNNRSLKEFLEFALEAGMCNDVNTNQMRLMKVLSREDSVTLSKLQLHRSAEKLANSEGSKSAILMLFTELFGSKFLDTGVVAFWESEDFATLMQACPLNKMVEWVSKRTVLSEVRQMATVN